MNTLNQQPPTFLPDREVSVRSNIYPQSHSRKRDLWRRRLEIRARRQAFEKLFFGEEVLVDHHDLNMTSNLYANAMSNHQPGELQPIDQGNVVRNALGSIRRC